MVRENAYHYTNRALTDRIEDRQKRILNPFLGSGQDRRFFFEKWIEDRIGYEISSVWFTILFLIWYCSYYYGCWSKTNEVLNLLDRSTALYDFMSNVFKTWEQASSFRNEAKYYKLRVCKLARNKKSGRQPGKSPRGNGFWEDAIPKLRRNSKKTPSFYAQPLS